MEKKRGTTIAVVAALIIAVVSLGVAFATFSTTLTINGNATVQATKWDIYFSDTGLANSKPAANAAITDITESNTIYPSAETVTATGKYDSELTISWQASFKSAGDKVVYKFYVRNDGNYDAQVSNTPVATANGGTNGGITCTMGGQAETEVCSHIHYGLYTDAAGTTAVAQGLGLTHGTSDEYYLIAWLDESYGGTDGSKLASSEVTTSTITTTVTYSQTGVAQ